MVDDIKGSSGEVIDYAKCIYVVIGQWVPFNTAMDNCAKYFQGIDSFWAR